MLKRTILMLATTTITLFLGACAHTDEGSGTGKTSYECTVTDSSTGKVFHGRSPMLGYAQQYAHFYCTQDTNDHHCSSPSCHRVD